jgi:hypothetical protein
MENIIVDGDSVKKIGIDILTGEACALSMRLLCELTPDMMQKYLNYTGIHVNIDNVEKSYYNNKNKFSCYLTWEIMEDLVIMELLENNEMVVEIIPNNSMMKNSGVCGQKHLMSGTKEEIKNHFKEYENHVLYNKSVWNEKTGQYDITEGLYTIGRSYSVYQEQPHRGFSNIHAFSGISQ